MRELEVRLALVCFGGASLAVYMNGISHEILKLVRASKVYHGLSAHEKRDASISYHDAAPNLPYACDTESHYFDLLRAIGPMMDLRIIVDVISGASAGGINGIFLARALAYDLDFEPLRSMWMKYGDIEELMEDETLAERGSKIFMYPIIWLLGDRIWQGEKPHAEARRKLSRFLRSRWFKPPFSGTRMLSWMLNANSNMGKTDPAKSLLPTGHQLDLFVSLTNFYGQRRTVLLHDPAMISEQQHQVSLCFSHRQTSGGKAISDFDDDNIPGLGFAARATSSFPGAFPPISLNDLKSYLAENGMDWSHEKSFFKKNFSQLNEDTSAIESMYFIDGGVTTNKPFEQAIRAVFERPAHREVSRRIIFVDPRPDTDIPPAGQQAETTPPRQKPGFFHTILSSLAEIPRNEPILGNLQAIEEQNRETRRLEAVLERVEADMAGLISDIIRLEPGRQISTAMLASWRESAHEEAHARAGFGYGVYIEGKIVQLVERLAGLMSRWQCELPKRKRLFKKTAEGSLFALINQWITEKGFRSEGDTSHRAAIPLFRGFDVDYRIRRLRFLVKRTNQQLRNSKSETDSHIYRTIKKDLYALLELYEARWRTAFYERLPVQDTLPDYLELVRKHMDLEELDLEADSRVASLLSEVQDDRARLSLCRAYVGFAFYDIVSLPMTAQHDLKEIDQILVDRISPLDCAHLHAPGASPLMGSKLFNFGAFFSRRARENDYIWGRIHAANRLIDFIVDAAGPDAAPDAETVKALRAKMALSILDTEEQHMQESADLIKSIRKQFQN